MRSDSHVLEHRRERSGSERRIAPEPLEQRREGATAVAIEQLANNASATVTATSGSPLRGLWALPLQAWPSYGRRVSNYGLEVLSEDECRALLATQRLGRVAVCGDQPEIVPVLYALLDGDVVFRTAPGEKLIAAALQRTVAFEVDAFDVDARQGWSVDVVGEAEEIRHPDERARAETLELEPWAGEARDRYVRIRARQVTGRRIASPAG